MHKYVPIARNIDRLFHKQIVYSMEKEMSWRECYLRLAGSVSGDIVVNMNVYQLYLWSELRVGEVRGDYNLYIQVQSPLSAFSLTCVIKETRPLFFLLQNFR